MRSCPGRTCWPALLGGTEDVAQAGRHAEGVLPGHAVQRAPALPQLGHHAGIEPIRAALPQFLQPGGVGRRILCLQVRQLEELFRLQGADPLAGGETLHPRVPPVVPPAPVADQPVAQPVRVPSVAFQ